MNTPPMTPDSTPAIAWSKLDPARRVSQEGMKPAYTNMRVTRGNPKSLHMKRRVVVTGIGAVSPNGIGREKFWQATRDGISGVRNITRFDASGYAVQVAGEVVGFDESLYVSPKDRQHVSRAVPLGIAAVQEAVADAGLDPGSMTRDELRSVGVIVGSGGGSQEFTEEQYRLYYTGHSKQCSVYTIPTSTIGTLPSSVY